MCRLWKAILVMCLQSLSILFWLHVLFFYIFHIFHKQLRQILIKWKRVLWRVSSGIQSKNVSKLCKWMTSTNVDSIDGILFWFHTFNFLHSVLIFNSVNSFNSFRLFSSTISSDGAAGPMNPCYRVDVDLGSTWRWEKESIIFTDSAPLRIWWAELLWCVWRPGLRLIKSGISWALAASLMQGALWKKHI